MNEKCQSKFVIILYLCNGIVLFILNCVSHVVSTKFS
jgi:hypothetical protein